MSIFVRSYGVVAAIAVHMALSLDMATASGAQTASTVIRCDATTTSRIHFLSWDTEGTGREKQNLLRKGAAVVARSGDTTAPLRVETPNNEQLRLIVEPEEAGQALKLVFPFDPAVTPTTVFGVSISREGAVGLPAIISAPDFGQMLLAVSPGSVKATGRLDGSRTDKIVDFVLTLSELPGTSVTLDLSPVKLAPPKGIDTDDAMWRSARRGWWNFFQPTAKWGEAGHRFSAPPGVLGNNVISDPVSFALYTYADAAFLVPEATPDVSLMNQVRHTLDWWLDEKITTSGECIGYWDYLNFLDSNPSLIISAWAYVEATGDEEWLRRRMPKLEQLSAFLESRDIDGDGMLEAVQSGNRGTLHEPKRSSCWWDAINCGHKDGFSNALAYRAWCCMADLHRKIGNADRVKHYETLARQLKAAYVPALLNPQTGWLAWWRSEDGELHDYASPVVNCLAIEYGLVEPELARNILRLLRAKIDAAGFERIELGVPSFLQPVPRADYLQPHGLGIGKLEDGSDTFGQYMNGGISASASAHFLTSHYMLGEKAYADNMLNAMLERQVKGGFQNGVTNAAPRGIDWTDWEGRPCGYEGYLADNYRFLLSVALRHPALRNRLYRPMQMD